MGGEAPGEGKEEHLRGPQDREREGEVLAIFGEAAGGRRNRGRGVASTRATNWTCRNHLLTPLVSLSLLLADPFFIMQNDQVRSASPLASL